MVCGIVGIVLGFVPFVNWAALVLDIVAVSLGGVVMSKAKHDPVANLGAAKAGVVLGIVGLAFFLIAVLCLASFYSAILGGAALS
ncbi:MAG: hypothetical protein FDZ75_00070 [Actinobacteria bacterium]|nr:MAG: hypothetical protein FDZ75_00070 [Actinomycetota bacterium]